MSVQKNLKCFLCQRDVELRQGQGASGLTSVYTLWSKSCARSLCQLFDLDPNSFEKILLNAEYCSACNHVVRNIDFGLRSLNVLQQSLADSRHTVETLLRESYESILISENGIKQEPLDEDDLPPLSHSQTQTYTNSVKLIFEALSSTGACGEVPYSRTNHINFERNYHSPSVLNTEAPEDDFGGDSLPSEDDNSDTNDYARLTRGSTRLRRVVTLPSYKFGDESDTGSAKSYGSEYMPTVEAVLGDIKVPQNSGSEKEADEDCEDSDSDDEDWESMRARASKKKYPGTRRNQRNKRAAATKSESKSKVRSKVRIVSSKGAPNPNRSAEKLPCSYDTECPYRTTSEVKMRAHINGVHKKDPKPFHCETCVGKDGESTQKFGSATRYYFHQREHHQSYEPVLKRGCTYDAACTYRTTSDIKMSAHVNGVHKKDPKPFHCEKCVGKDGQPFKFGSATRYYWHQKKFHQGSTPVESEPTHCSEAQRIDCTFEPGCCYRTSSEIKMKAHINGAHKGDPKPFHCEECLGKEGVTAKFGSATRYYYHQRKHHVTVEPTIFCDVCNRSFIAPWELRKHLQVAHLSPKSKLRCFLCRKTFDEEKPEDLAQHEELHKSRVENPFACLFCEQKDFTNSYDLSVHVSQEHEEALIKCDTCNKVFNSERKLKRHFDTSHKERNPALKCPQCDFIGLCRSSLRRHIDWHSAQREFQCDQCPNMYKSRSCLNYHIRVTHTKNLPYKCHICGKAFGATCQLKAHEEIHNTVKSYYCEKCGKAFMARKHLIQHMRSHDPTRRKSNPSRVRNPKNKRVARTQPYQAPTPAILGNVLPEMEEESGSSVHSHSQTGSYMSGSYTANMPMDMTNQHRDNPVMRRRDQPPVPASASNDLLSSNWGNTESQQFLNLPSNPLQYQHLNTPTLDLSQTSPYLAAFQQHHSHYFSSMH